MRIFKSRIEWNSSVFLVSCYAFEVKGHCIREHQIPQIRVFSITIRVKMASFLFCSLPAYIFIVLRAFFQALVFFEIKGSVI